MKTILKAGALAAVTSAALLSAPVSAATLTAITPGGVTFADSVGTRFRGPSTGAELFVGIGDLGVGANRSEAEFTYKPGGYAFNFTYDSVTGLISSTLGGSTISYTGTVGLITDTLVLQLSNRVPSTLTRQGPSFSLGPISVNGELVAAPATCGIFCEWSVTDFATASTLSVAGKLKFSGSLRGSESELMKFQITGNTVAPVAPVPLPAALPLLLAGLGGLGLIARKRRKKA